MHAWSADGRRPWHHRFTVRDTDHGPVGLWLGSWSRDRAELVGDIKADLMAYLYLSGKPWADLVNERVIPDDDRIQWHPGRCTPCGWIGIGVLPDDPRPAGAVWSGWTHLVHARYLGHPVFTVDCSCWQTLIPQYDELLTTPTDDWLALVGTPALAGVV